MDGMVLTRLRQRQLGERRWLPEISSDRLHIAVLEAPDQLDALSGRYRLPGTVLV
jgi:hypothetical protein